MAATRHNIRVKTTGISRIFYCDTSETQITFGFIKGAEASISSPQKTIVEPIYDFVRIFK